jgi:hypothetical protein
MHIFFVLRVGLIWTAATAKALTSISDHSYESKIMLRCAGVPGGKSRESFTNYG